MMTDTTQDAAIDAAETATEGMPYLGNVSNHDRTYARALIAKLLEGMEPNDAPAMVPSAPHTWQSYLFGHNAALTEIRRRAGIEGDK